MCAALAVVLSVHALASIDESDTMVQINGHMDVTVLSTDIMDEPTSPVPYVDESDVMLQIHGHMVVNASSTDIVDESTLPASFAVIDQTEMLQIGEDMDTNTTSTDINAWANVPHCPKPNGCTFDGSFPAPFRTSDWDCRPCNPHHGHANNDPWAVSPASRVITKEQLGSGCCILLSTRFEKYIYHCGCDDCWWGYPHVTTRQPYMRHFRPALMSPHNKGTCGYACRDDPRCYWSMFTRAFVTNEPGCFLFKAAPAILLSDPGYPASSFCYTKNHWATNVRTDKGHVYR